MSHKRLAGLPQLRTQSLGHYHGLVVVVSILSNVIQTVYEPAKTITILTATIDVDQGMRKQPLGHFHLSVIVISLSSNVTPPTCKAVTLIPTYLHILVSLSSDVIPATHETVTDVVPELRKQPGWRACYSHQLTDSQHRCSPETEMTFQTERQHKMLIRQMDLVTEVTTAVKTILSSCFMLVCLESHVTLATQETVTDVYPSVRKQPSDVTLATYKTVTVIRKVTASTYLDSVLRKKPDSRGCPCNHQTDTQHTCGPVYEETTVRETTVRTLSMICLVVSLSSNVTKLTHKTIKKIKILTAITDVEQELRKQPSVVTPAPYKSVKVIIKLTLNTDVDPAMRKHSFGHCLCCAMVVSCIQFSDPEAEVDDRSEDSLQSLQRLACLGITGAMSSCQTIAIKAVLGYTPLGQEVVRTIAVCIMKKKG
ncbi:hypothetical protein J6590_100052 [Homalodisca vitripennis]|nr:hypothetical protein J6590_100052 [Homalodisca vitripennis]